jgi:putative transposase
MASDGTGAHCPPAIMLLGGRWEVASPLRTRQVEARMEARGVAVEPATSHRGPSKERPRLEAAFHRRKRPVGGRWRMAETSIKGKGQWRARAVDQSGAPRDVFLTEHRDTEAAQTTRGPWRSHGCAV